MGFVLNSFACKIVYIAKFVYLNTTHKVAFFKPADCFWCIAVCMELIKICVYTKIYSSDTRNYLIFDCYLPCLTTKYRIRSKATRIKDRKVNAGTYLEGRLAHRQNAVRFIQETNIWMFYSMDRTIFS